jgi:hopanoid C-2 methylase
VAAAIILGLDTDTADTEAHLKEFVESSQVPMLTINLLQALPKTALWDRLARANRLMDEGSRESNVRFLRPYPDVIATWRRCVAYAYAPERLYARFAHQISATYANRLVTPPGGRITRSNLKRGATLFFNLLVQVGMFADYRRPFWRIAWQALKRGQVEPLFGIGFISYHLIEFSREALRGDQNASFYSARARETA